VLLDARRRAGTLAAGLDAYERRRRPRVAYVATTAARIGRLAEVTHPVGRALRDRVLLPVARRMATAETSRAVMQEEVGVLMGIGRA
jgi:2-polyprenyl-6-methoxyphenol hydroxylase-like FAD-dependent oxidoreductase